MDRQVKWGDCDNSKAFRYCCFFFNSNLTHYCIYITVHTTAYYCIRAPVYYMYDI